MNIQTEKSHSLETLLLVLILVPLFKPTGLGQIALFNTLFQLGKAVSLCVILFLFLGSLRKIKVTSLEVSLAVFWVAYTIGCYQSCAGYETVLNYSLTSLALLLLFKLEAMEGRVRELVNALWCLFTVFILLQVATVFIVMQGVVLFPGDYTRMYLFGEDNYSAFVMLPMTAIVLYADAVNEDGARWKHRVTIVSYLLALASYIYVQSVAAALGFLLLGICYLGKGRLNSFVHKLTLKKIAATFIVLLLLVLVFHIQDFIGGIMSTFLDKDIFTLNSRTIIWKQAEGLIADKPLFGWGDGLTEAMIWGGHAHNIFLQLLTISGVVGTIAFFCYIGRAFVDAGKSILSNSGSILIGALAAMALLTFFDFYIGISALFCFVAFVSVVPASLTSRDSQLEGADGGVAQ